MTSGKAGIELIFSEDGVFDAGIRALKDGFAEAAALVCVREGVDPVLCEVSITFETEDGIRELNAKYRDKDAVTDVLSFPMYENAAEICALQSIIKNQQIQDQVCVSVRDGAELAEEELIAPDGDSQVLSLGDVVICPAVARRQAAEYGHNEQREFVYLFVHSMLHLLGYDHEDEAKERAEMRTAEEEIMRQLGLVRAVIPARAGI